MNTMSTVVVVRNPFTPTTREEYPLVHPTTVRAWLAESNFAPDAQPTICLKNGEPLLREAWETTTLAKDDVLAFVFLPQNGGGGGDKILRSVLTIALLVAAPTAAGTLFAAGSVSYAVVYAGVLVGGTTIINAILPPLPPLQAGNLPGQARPMPSSPKAIMLASDSPYPSSTDAILSTPTSPPWASGLSVRHSHGSPRGWLRHRQRTHQTHGSTRARRGLSLPRPPRSLPHMGSPTTPPSRAGT